MTISYRLSRYHLKKFDNINTNIINRYIQIYCLIMNFNNVYNNHRLSNQSYINNDTREEVELKRAN